MTQTMLELADDIANIPHEINMTPRQARLLQEAVNRLRETAALSPSQEVPAQPQRMWSAPAEFVMWALMEGAWQGADVDGGASQDKAVELGLIVATPYDPKEHGETAYCEPGDQWFVPSEALLAALAGKPDEQRKELLMDDQPTELDLAYERIMQLEAEVDHWRKRALALQYQPSTSAALTPAKSEIA